MSTIPFSWEMIPGVPKSIPSSEEAAAPCSLPPPPPPGSFREPLKRSLSRRVFWREEEEDPFLAALKECTKDYKVKGDQMKKRFGVWGSKPFLWCKCSFDVEEGNLRRRPIVTNGGPVIIPRGKVHGLIRMHKRVN